MNINKIVGITLTKPVPSADPAEMVEKAQRIFLPLYRLLRIMPNYGGMKYATPTPMQEIVAKPYRAGLTRRQLRGLRLESGRTKPKKVRTWLIEQLVAKGKLPAAALRKPPKAPPFGLSQKIVTAAVIKGA